MRISDWSSDVCSSDLPWRLARIDIPGAKPHPDNLVESLAMASVLPPIPQYRPLFQKRASESLSDAQLEAIIYEGDAFSRDLPSRFVTNTHGDLPNSEDRRVGKECVNKWRSRWDADNTIKNR